jgi:chromatin segregation and condensation protein Rec8/ScpA/Scc1 (kleisin family)
MKQIEVTCPCCETLMVVDVLTQKIMRHAKPGQVDETGKAVLDEGRWDSAQDKVSKRTERGRDQFENALGKEKTREGDLDDLFDAAQRKLRERRERLEGEEPGEA